ncbi:hypothetical protein LR48_Vigan01g322300 [Vigna angularis]|uniref:Pentacotripeptide-repeat region of PRORP domain-containing protein n=1 Tax=Phaseolus angularis TaxID=3914 RepID=A0A0L9TTD2_PHAAN|nr:hypothetical protein LR48_Vigan01g322300 [Vigna angularis]
MSIRWPRRLTPTYLSQIIRTQKNPIKALHIFNEAKSRYPNYCHNGPVYATMINILGTSGRLTEMRDVIEQMREDSCECKDSVFVSVIKTYANAGQVDEAMSLYKTIPQFNFVESSCGWEVRSRVRALNLLMYALCQKSRSDLALQLFQEMDYQSCYPNRDSYAILMKGLCQDRRLHEATHLLYSMFWRISQKGNGEDIVVYRTLLDALCDAGKLEEAVEILGVMVLSDYILRFLKFGDFERGEVRVRIEKTERDWEKGEGGIERVEEGGREGGEGEGGDEKERHGHMGGRELGQRLKVAIVRCDG